MDDDEAALLAELKAISAQSATSRFGDHENGETTAVGPPSPARRKGGSPGSSASANSLVQKHRHIVTSPPRVSPPSSVNTSLDEEEEEDVVEIRRREAEQRRGESSLHSSVASLGSGGMSSSTPPTSPFGRRKTRSEKRKPRHFAARSVEGKDEQAAAAQVDSAHNEKSNPVDNNNSSSEVVEPKTTPVSPRRRENWKSVKKRHKDRISNSPRQASAATVDVAAAPSIPESQPSGFKTEQTFTGVRGGAAEDAELLALLRGVSNKSAASRFDDGSSNPDETATDDAPPPENKKEEPEKPWKRQGPRVQTSSPKPAQATTAPLSPRSPGSGVKPWERSGRKLFQDQMEAKQADKVNAVAATTKESVTTSSPAAAPPQGGGIKNEIKSTFIGERGGAAEDAELLALLRGVSNKASDRFADDDDGVPENPSVDVVVEEKVTAPAKKETKEEKEKPWKRRGNTKLRNKVAQPQTDDVIVVAAPVDARDEQQSSGSGFFKSESTFTGERGGAAEDPELLALLRGVSTQSSGANRFSDGENAGANQELQGNGIINDGRHETVESSKINESSAPEPDESAGYGLKQEGASSFQGERGGAAEDAELLALLRGVSKTSSSADRFDDGAEEAPSVKVEKVRSPVSNDVVKPWHRKASKVQKPEKSETTVVAVPPPPAASTPPAVDDSVGFGLKSSLPSTFQGERGGSAEDAELLALLRGVSTKSSSADRFATGDSEEPAVAPNSMQHSPKRTAAPVPRMSAPPTSAPSPSAAATDDVKVSVGDLPAAFGDKSWKIRAKAFELLSSMLSSQTGGSDLVSSDSVLAGLDGIVPGFVEDTHPATLDKALAATLLYVKNCEGASDAEQAKNISASMLKKNAFSSRPNTVKAACEVCLMLMEVGKDGTASLHAVVQLLLSNGLAAKKPKVVQASVSLLQDAMFAFGAANLPLPALMSSLPKVMSHSNAKVRQVGLTMTAELCRVLGSKAAVQDILDTMKKAQLSQLDSLLSKQPQPTPPTRKLRSSVSARDGTSSEDSPTVSLGIDPKELEAQRFAARPEVDLIAAVAKTEYASRLEHKKWSEKVGAMNTVLECAGEQPYKLKQPHSSAMYAPLISDMKKLLAHTHFAVCNKAMQVLSMLASGVGEKLFPQLRPLLTTLLQLSKDKKLTTGVSGCLDAFFGNVIGFDHILDREDGLPVALDEKKQRNALARASAMDFVCRCVTRRNTAGPRGELNSTHADFLVVLLTDKLADSDAAVRKSSLDSFRALKETKDAKIIDITSKAINSLQSSNSRAFKALAGQAPSGNSTTTGKERGTTSTKTRKPVAREREPASRPKLSAVPPVDKKPVQHFNSAAPLQEDAISFLEQLGIPSWSSEEDEDGILAGLKSSKWLLRQNATLSLTSYVESQRTESAPCNVADLTVNIVVVVKEFTRSFKESNVNILKAIIQLFVSLIGNHTSKEVEFPHVALGDGVELAVRKISDRKVCALCKELLLQACVVSPPVMVVEEICKSLKTVRSPVSHEEVLKWFQGFLSAFGPSAVGSGIGSLLPWLIEEMEFSNMKVKKEAAACVGVLFEMLGPNFQATSLSLAKKPETKTSLSTIYSQRSYDAGSMSSKLWEKKCIIGAHTDNEQSGSVQLDIPKTSLVSALSQDVVSRMGTTSGKAAWKKRKEALDEVNQALVACVGLLDGSATEKKQVVDIGRAVRDRLSDTQINLKPVAAKTLGLLMSKVDKSFQPKVGRLCFPALLVGAMNDIKKPMREACLESLRLGTCMSSLEGNGPNMESIEALVTAFAEEVTEASIKAGGLPDVLGFFVEISESFPNLDSVAVTRGQMLGPKVASVLVECLTSSKAETRSAATTLLEKVLASGTISADSLKKACGKLKPAKQRTVAPLVARFSRDAATSTTDGKVATDRKQEREESQKKDISRASSKPTQRSTPSQPKQSHGTSNGNSNAPQVRHPLCMKPGAKAVVRTMVWPEYPEEPTGQALYTSLKKAWSQLLLPTAVAALFPTTGIRKQDEAQRGCELLIRALETDDADGTRVLLDQLDFVLRWTTFVLCCRENTVGLQSLLGFTKALLDSLVNRNHDLPDSSVLEFLTFILEKASNAKGRFRDTFLEIVSIMQTLLPPKRMGAVLCVAVIERSAHAKARVMACSYCRGVVDEIGLTGCGKKGVLAAAKALSDEKLPENRAAALDLLETIYGRMNGESSRLTRICGPNLSDKALQLLEERCKRRDSKPMRSPRVSKTPNTSKPDTRNANSADEFPGALYDELPALSLRKGLESRHSEGQHTSREPAEVIAFARPSTVEETAGSAKDSGVPQSINDAEDPGGAAASLRARLMKIREKSKNGATDGTSLLDVGDDKVIFDNEMRVLQGLMAMPGPLAEETPELVACIDSLKRFHAALSKQPNPTVGMSTLELTGLRTCIVNELNSTVEQLTHLIRFSFDCGEKDKHSGMSIPLLSVCLATLMALFRDQETCVSVSQDVLTLLVRETGSSLLDPRLSSSSKLDEATGSQMVRAINKLAVQAATGASRHTSFLALMGLQQQLTNESGETKDANFNNRLSRVVTKLFARVLRAEEATESPFDSTQLDLEAVIASMEDVLEATSNPTPGMSTDIAKACKSMIQSLVDSIVSVNGRSTEFLKKHMDAVGIEREGSHLGELIAPYEDPSDNYFDAESEEDLLEFAGPSEPSKDVASLVSALVSAPRGVARETALQNLQNYKSENGDEELNAHLQQVSTPFRIFIKEQLGAEPTPEKEQPVAAETMTDRLRSLRTRLQATELAVQSAVDDDEVAAPQVETPKSRAARRTRLAQPSPSRIVPPGGGRAAALRARLEAMKQKEEDA